MLTAWRRKASNGDLLKWCFLFWIGQVAALTAVFSLLLRVMR